MKAEEKGTIKEKVEAMQKKFDVSTLKISHQFQTTKHIT